MSSCYVAAEGIRWVVLDDGVAIFNPESWETHVLNETAALVLEMLESEPRGVDEIEAALREMLAAEEREAAGEHADKLVRHLAFVGLIRERIGAHRAHH